MTTIAPASSNTFLVSSAFSFETFSNTGLGTVSIKSLASFKPKEVKVLTTLITLILLAVGTSFKTTVNSVFSSTTASSNLTAEEILVAAIDETLRFACTLKVSSIS